jgi:hypothetical protein
MARYETRRPATATELQATLVDARSAFPIDDIDQFPGILIELKLNLSLFVHRELA